MVGPLGTSCLCLRVRIPGDSNTDFIYWVNGQGVLGFCRLLVIYRLVNGIWVMTVTPVVVNVLKCTRIIAATTRLRLRQKGVGTWKAKELIPLTTLSSKPQWMRGPATLGRLAACLAVDAAHSKLGSTCKFTDLYRRSSISGTTFSGNKCLSGTIFHAI
jgi:hypothetical protein